MYVVVSLKLHLTLEMISDLTQVHDCVANVQ